FNYNIKNIKDFKTEVYDGDELVKPQDDGTYLLTNKTYTYKAKARGYREITKTFEVKDNDVSITVEFDNAAAYDISWYDASKTSFEISTPEQLAGLAAIFNGKTDITESFEGKTITITNDLNLDEATSGWLPIGDRSHPFNAKFDGCNHTITVNIDRPDEQYIGLFGALGQRNGEVKNLTVDGTVTGKFDVGGIVGCGLNDNLVENCVNKATVKGEERVGGILGEQNNNIRLNNGVKNCINEGTVEGKYDVAGIVGMSGGAIISNCYNKANITGETYIGGICGHSANQSIMLDNYNSGKITSTKNYAGGIIGDTGSAYIANSYNEGEILGVNYVGGITGNVRAVERTRNVYNLGTVEGSGNYIGGISGQGQVLNCYDLGEVSASETSTNVGIITGSGKANNCYYIDTFTKYTDNQGEALAKEDFENGNLADKLNDNLKLYSKTWIVKDNVTTFGDKTIQFTVEARDPYYQVIDEEKLTTVLKDSEGNIIEPYKEGKIYYANLNLNEQYEVTVSSPTYEPVTQKFTYTGYNTVTVRMSFIPTTVSFKSNVENAKVKLYYLGDKYEIPANEDGSYDLIPEKYEYKAIADGYPMAQGTFTIDKAEKNEPKEINIEFKKGYDVKITSDSTTNQKVVVYDESNTVMETTTPNEYNLNPGKYTYVLEADGYETVNGEFEVVDKDLGTISNELKKVYDLSWYDADKTEYTINTKQELMGLAAIANGTSTSVKQDSFAGKTIKLGKDIQLNSSDDLSVDKDGNYNVSENVYIWTPIQGFEGTFDGNNHSIKGIYMYEQYRSALFSNNNGTIKDLTVSGYIKGGSYLAGISVYNYGNIE
ncbi:MAG: hypothetical protein ACI4PU_06645, partial [Intestinibacter sp.]